MSALEDVLPAFEQHLRVEKGRSPHTVRAIAGQRPSIVMYPLEPGAASAPVSSTMRTARPGSATPAAPGTPSCTPGRVETMAAPDSDCHHVSTIGARPPPTCA